MNKPLARETTLPTPPAPKQQDRIWYRGKDEIDALLVWARELVRSLSVDLKAIHDQINSAVQGVGNDLEAADVVVVECPIHRISGSTVVRTITAPDGFSGPIFLIAVGNVTFGAYTEEDGVRTGNIERAISLLSGVCQILVYDFVRQVWYPAI